MNSEIRFGVLTISDRSARGEREDLTGPALAETIVNYGWKVTLTDVIPDDLPEISRTLTKWVDGDQIDVLLTNGGTGFSPRDVTPEATSTVIARPTPGLTELMRIESMKITPYAALSRAAAGIRGKCLIINLPGSPKGAVENLQFIAKILPHAVSLMEGRQMEDEDHSLD